VLKKGELKISKKNIFIRKTSIDEREWKKEKK